MKILTIIPAARGVHPKEAEDRRIEVCRSYSAPGTQVEVDFPEAVPGGFDPFGGTGGALGAARNHIAMAERMIKAEQEGYDAVIPFGMLDFGVELARTRCSIPIVGQAQATYCVAAMLADRVGVITYQSGNHGHMLRQLHIYGFEHLLVGLGAAGMPNNQMPGRRKELFDNFVSEGKRLVKEGAELIVCHGMSMAPVNFSAREYAEGIGVPVLEGMGCAVAMAEAWVRTGAPTSRIRYPGERSE